jgi:hypothetical protein
VGSVWAPDRLRVPPFTEMPAKLATAAGAPLCRETDVQLQNPTAYRKRAPPASGRRRLNSRTPRDLFPLRHQLKD